MEKSALAGLLDTRLAERDNGGSQKANARFSEHLPTLYSFRLLTAETQLNLSQSP